MASDGGGRRLLYVCSYPPSDLSGAASILRNLFEDFPAARMRLLVDQDSLEAARRRGAAVPWPAEAIRLPDWRRTRAFLRRVLGRQGGSRGSPPPSDHAEGRVERDRLSRWGWHAATLTEIACTPLIAIRAVRAVRRDHLQGIFAVQGSPAWVVGAYLASLISGTPLFLFSMDAWRGNSLYRSPVLDWVADFFEPRVLRRSNVSWAISPFQAKEWLARYGVTSEVCWHSVDVDVFERADAGVPVGPPVIVMLGTVYAVNGGEVRRLCRAVRGLREDSHPDLTLRLYTTQTAEQLAAEGLPDATWLDVGSLEPDQVPSALAEAHILFVGLSFEPRSRRIGQVAFPTKLAEYLAAGRPILVNAPRDATASTYVGDHAVGVVVDEPDDQAVVEGLKLVLEDRAFADTLGERGRELARSNHDRSRVVRRFRELIDRPVTQVHEVVMDRDHISGW